jgi:hypothetical protein
MVQGMRLVWYVKNIDWKCYTSKPEAMEGKLES